MHCKHIRPSTKTDTEYIKNWWYLLELYCEQIHSDIYALDSDIGCTAMNHRYKIHYPFHMVTASIYTVDTQDYPQKQILSPLRIGDIHYNCTVNRSIHTYRLLILILYALLWIITVNCIITMPSILIITLYTIICRRFDNIYIVLLLY